MPRTARLYYPGGIFHIISRFDRREFLMSDDTHRKRYLGLISQTLPRTDMLILGWSLMSSHIHLVVKAGLAPLASLMKPINSGFAVWKNLVEKGREGAVFSGRYKSILVDADAYLLALVRYVHNNPVRAGVVERAENSTWTSHGYYMGQVPAPSWLNMGQVLGLLSSDASRARQLFGEFVDEGRHEGRRPDLVGERTRETAKVVSRVVGDGWLISDPIVGSEEFAGRVLRDIGKADAQLGEARLMRQDKVRNRPRLEEVRVVVCELLVS